MPISQSNPTIDKPPFDKLIDEWLMIIGDERGSQMKIGVLPNEGAKKPYRTIKITGLKPFLALTSNFVETGFYDHLVESFTDANGYDCMFEPTEVTMAALSQAE